MSKTDRAWSLMVGFFLLIFIVGLPLLADLAIGVIEHHLKAIGAI